MVCVLSLHPWLTAPLAAAADEGEPLRCWWRTSASAVMVGEPFTVVLTCAALQTPSTTAVVDRARLDPRAIELAPFEVLGGEVAPDVPAGDRVFFQIQYRLRFINEAFFNQEVTLPPLAISYRIQTRGTTPGQEAATEGMERRFAMPNQSLRITSLVPADANDIRDASPVTFADLETQSSRGRLLKTSGLILLGLAAVVGFVGLGRSVASRLKTTAPDAGLCSESAVLWSGARALAAVKRRRDEGGWSGDAITQALAATRLVAECALDRAPSQRVGDPEEPIPSGAIGVRRWWRSPRLVVASGSATPKALTAALARKGGARGRRLGEITALQGALTSFTQAGFSDVAPLDEAALDGALADVDRIARRLAWQRTWLMQRLTLRAWRRPTRGEGAVA